MLLKYGGVSSIMMRERAGGRIKGAIVCTFTHGYYAKMPNSV